MEHLLTTIGKWGVSVVLSIASIFGFGGGVVNQNDLQTKVQIPPVLQPANNLGAEVQPFAGQTYTLAGSGLSSSATSIILASLTNPQSGYEIVDSDLSSTFYITIEPGNRTRQEIVSCTTVTQNASNEQATLSGCTRGLSPIFPYTASSTIQFSHGGGSQVVFSNPPQFYNQFTAKANNETVTGTWGFSVAPTSSDTCDASTELCNKAYVDSTANAGAATSTESNGGIVELGTLAEQANSFDGGANKPTVLQTKNSTSTCQVVGTYNIVASSTTGKLDKNCFDQSLNYSFTGTNTNSGVTSFSATTSFSNATTSFNGINYSMPSVVGASSTALTTTANGQLTWNPFSSLLTQFTTDVTVDNSSATTTLISTTLPANFLSTNKAVRLKVYAKDVGIVNGDRFTFSLIYGATTIATHTVTSADSGNGLGGLATGYIEAMLYSAGTTSSQEGVIEGQIGTANLVATASQVQMNVYGVGTGSENSTTALTLSLQFKTITADTSNQLTASNGYIEALR